MHHRLSDYKAALDKHYETYGYQDALQIVSRILNRDAKTQMLTNYTRLPTRAVLASILPRPT